MIHFHMGSPKDQETTMFPSRLLRQAVQRLDGQRVREDVLERFRTVFRILCVPSRDDIDELDDRLGELEEIIDELSQRTQALTQRVAQQKQAVP